MIKRLVRALLAWTRTEYACYKIFRTDLVSYQMPALALPAGYSMAVVTRAEVEKATHPEIAEQATYGGQDSLGFAVLRDLEIVSVSWAWYGERYREERNFWPLGPREAKVVQSITIPGERGRGFIPMLMHYSAHELKLRGFESVYSRIWWNHHSSLRIPEKVGRTHIATVLEMRLFGAKRPLRFVKRHHP